MYADDLMRPWLEAVLEEVPGVELFDVHTHVGDSDPDGSRLPPDELLDALELATARGVAFPMHEPDGYPPANDRVIAESAASGGRLFAFCRVDAHADPVDEATRCLDAGARGIKLHPRAEHFSMSDPAVRAVFGVAAERRAPVIIHAGHGIPPMGEPVLEYCKEFPEARVILAHAGISDLSWIWRHVEDHPNLFFDTSLDTQWWNLGDLLALFALVPPGRILFGSDAPYGTPVQSAAVTLRFALHAGLNADQIRAVAGEQARRLVEGEDPLDLGPAPGSGHLEVDPLLELVASGLSAALGRIKVGDTADQALALARRTCRADEQGRRGEVFRSIVALLDRHENYTAERERDGSHVAGVHLIVLAACLARTPTVRLPYELPA